MIFLILALLYKDAKYYPDGACIIPPTEYEEFPQNGQKQKTLYTCNKEYTRLMSSDCAAYVSSSSFKLKSGAVSNGGGLFLKFTSVDYTQSSLIYQCQFNGCKGKQGGAIYILGVNSDMFFNITQCIFKENTATTAGGAIYFNAVYSTVSDCQFINNKCTASVSANNNGAEIYYTSLEKSADGNTDKAFLIKNCKILKDPFQFLLKS